MCLLSLAILEFSKIVMHELWYIFMKLKYGEKGKLCYLLVYLHEIEIWRKREIMLPLGILT